jgi:hypothetical protein
MASKGRIDAIVEYPEYAETVEWKTYADGGVSAYDRYQTITNGVLVNYRYARAEDDFNGNVNNNYTGQGAQSQTALSYLLSSLMSVNLL